LDYDGTIVRNDLVPPPVLDVIADARRRNVTVILVTGRILKYPRRAILSI
jgi:hydroxymethylpyrimidine pyrophosphatase-like HAD family hydrolase